MEKLRYHPAAEAFPMMDKQQYNGLLKDIQERGQQEPITVCEGAILDGRSRYKACLELGLKPKTKEHHGDPWQQVWSLNCQQRDIQSEEQRYLIWKYVNEQSDAKIEDLKCSAVTVRRGNQLARERPDLAEKVRKGAIRSKTAHRIRLEEGGSGKKRTEKEVKESYVNGKPTFEVAMKYGRMAVAQLKGILKCHHDRDDAYDYVVRWINENR